MLWADVSLEPWPTGKDYESHCAHEECQLNGPMESCTCGIHAWFSYDLMVRHWLPHGVQEPYIRLSGVVSAAGAVVLAEWGWRAQYARVEAVMFDSMARNDPTIAKEVADAYGVPIIYPRSYREFCASEGLRIIPPEDSPQ